MKRLDHQRGITLIELMIVVAVVAILASVAVGSYRNQIIRANRTEATAAPMRVRAAQERFFLQNHRYAKNSELTKAPPEGLGERATTPNGGYTIKIADGATATTYQAVATATGGQLKDVATCQTLTIDQDGNKTPAESTGCWRN
jgi:type IV pilus assembly protein PilE